ncbi:MAG TPA: hypothetical protein VNG35_05640, partial [Gemmatimonadales bacterium]|nr:hypothetical protein [Gemmatimonadales bacterium]
MLPSPLPPSRNTLLASLGSVLLLMGCANTAPRTEWTAAGKRAVVYTTADSSTLRLTPTDTLAFAAQEPTSEGRVYVFVDPQKTFQTMIGIGGALTDASAETFAKLPTAAQDELLQAYYNTDRGIGYTLARTNINSCDFSSDSYTYVSEGDSTL